MTKAMGLSRIQGLTAPEAAAMDRKYQRLDQTTRMTLPVSDHPVDRVGEVGVFRQDKDSECEQESEADDQAPSCGRGVQAIHLITHMNVDSPNA